MPAPSRDRLARPVDISGLYGGAARRVNLIVDDPGLLWAGLSRNPARNVHGNGGGVGSGPGPIRVGLGQRVAAGRENRGATRGRGMGGGVLPSWYPRTPLRDITSIVRAIERRREELHGEEAAEAPQQETEAPTPSSAQLKHDVGLSTPIPTITVKSQLSPATQLWKIMGGIPNEKGLDSGLLTPQKKLLNSIEKVREVWLEEQQKLQRTPAAKNAEREKKVRTLMSMR